MSTFKKSKTTCSPSTAEDILDLLGQETHLLGPFLGFKDLASLSRTRTKAVSYRYEVCYMTTEQVTLSVALDIGRGL